MCWDDSKPAWRLAKLHALRTIMSTYLLFIQNTTTAVISTGNLHLMTGHFTTIQSSNRVKKKVLMTCLQSYDCHQHLPWSHDPFWAVGNWLTFMTSCSVLSHINTIYDFWAIFQQKTAKGHPVDMLDLCKTHMVHLITMRIV